jgi:hypothetical protein
MSQLDTTIASNSITPDITSILAINAKDSTVNVVGRDQTFITNNYNVDPNCDEGIWINQPAAQLIILPDKIYRWLSAVIPSTNYHGALKVRLKDTGLWFINGARFARWKVAADDFLWICGTRMYFYHLRAIADTELLWQLVPERPS